MYNNPEYTQFELFFIHSNNSKKHNKYKAKYVTFIKYRKNVFKKE